MIRINVSYRNEPIADNYILVKKITMKRIYLFGCLICTIEIIKDPQV